MLIEILYAGLLSVNVVEHREGNVLALGLVHYDGTHQVGFLDTEDVEELYRALGDILLTTYEAEDRRREKRVNDFLSAEGDTE